MDCVRQKQNPKSVLKSQCITDFSEIIDGKFETAVHCTVKVELKDGTYHEDIGYGQGIHKTSKGLSMKKARKVNKCSFNFHVFFIDINAAYTIGSSHRRFETSIEEIRKPTGEQSQLSAI